MNIDNPTPSTNSDINGRYTYEELMGFMNLSRTYAARAMELSGAGHKLNVFERCFLPQGHVVKCPNTGKIEYFMPADGEYPDSSLGGSVALELSRMGHHERYLYCLTKKHVLNLFHRVNMNDFLVYFSAARHKFPEPFSIEVDLWIWKIAKENAEKQDNDNQN